jgi:hypothetical protein
MYQVYRVQQTEAVFKNYQTTILSAL